MFISKIKINNYRCFVNFECNFTETKNVIIGHNCTGKSNLLQALGIIFNPGSKKKLDINDFNKYIPLEKLKRIPPRYPL